MSEVVDVPSSVRLVCVGVVVAIDCDNEEERGALVGNPRTSTSSARGQVVSEGCSRHS